MKVCLTALFLGVACFLFQAGAAEPTEAERKSFLETKVKAEKGDAKAQTLLGDMYGDGLGVAKDEAEAVKWYRKAADQGYATAQFNLGVMYAFGRGVKQDSVEAVKWWRKAAEKNYAMAQYNLGVCYEKSEGVDKDDAEAVKWYRKAAEQNCAIAQSNLGSCYYSGRGVDKDYVEAYAWFNIAAQERKIAAEKRDALENKMSPQQVIAGQKRTKELRGQIEAKLKSGSRLPLVNPIEEKVSGSTPGVPIEKSVVSDDHVYTLYRNSVVDKNMRMHVATFDANEGEDYNRGNCEIAQMLFQGQLGVKTKFWSEKGRYRK